MGLFSREPIWKKTINPRTAKNAREYEKLSRERDALIQKAARYIDGKVADSDTLSVIALEAPEFPVRKAALEKLSRQAGGDALIGILLRSSDTATQEMALKKLSPQADTSALDASFYFSAPAGLRTALLERITDRQTLRQIALRDKSPGTTDDEYAQKRRAAALKKLDEPDLAAQFLGDESYIVRKEAFRQAGNPQAIIHYLTANPGCDIPDRQEMLAAFSEEQLRVLDAIPTLRREVKHAICHAAGHVRGEKCKCARCGKALTHAFGADGVCLHCGGKRFTGREDLSVKDGDVWHVYGVREYETIRYPDGTEEKFATREVITDQGTYQWLNQD